MQKEALLERGYKLLLEKIERVEGLWNEENSRFVPKSFGFPFEREKRIKRIVENLLEEVLAGRDWESLSEEEKREVKKRFLRKIIGFHLRPEAWHDRTFKSYKWFDKVFVFEDFVLLVEDNDDSAPLLWEYGYDKKRKKPVLLLKVSGISTQRAAELFLLDLLQVFDKLYGLCKKPSLFATYVIL